MREDTVTVFGILYTRSSEEDYEAACNPDAWTEFIESCKLEAHISSSDGDTAGSILDAPLPYASYRRFVNAVLTPGIPGSVLPVESFYKPWSEGDGTSIGSNVGYYMGDHARHIQSICESLGIGIPESFSAMPDHLALLIELLAFFEDNGTPAAAKDFIENHLDWLPDYIEALSQREAVEQDPSLSNSIRFYCELTDMLKKMLEYRTREGE